MPNNTVSIKDELDYIGIRIFNVRDHGLEVIYDALKFMKGNPNLTIQEAFERGCIEWDI